VFLELLLEPTTTTTDTATYITPIPGAEYQVVLPGGLAFVWHSAVTIVILAMIASYVSSTYQVWPVGMDLEGTIFELDDTMCQKIAEDVKTRFKRYLKYIEVECL
jgi:hypothetical protein